MRWTELLGTRAQPGRWSRSGSLCAGVCLTGPLRITNQATITAMRPATAGAKWYTATFYWGNGWARHANELAVNLLVGARPLADARGSVSVRIIPGAERPVDRLKSPGAPG